MNLRIRRRRFGQLAIASAATAAIANLAGKAVAQQSQIIYGVRLSQSSLTAQVASTDVANVANTTPALTLISSDLATGKDLSTSEVAATTVSNSSIAIESVATAVSVEPLERITGFTTLSDGTFVNTSVSTSLNGSVTRLILTDSKSFKTQSTLKVSGFPNNNSTVESLLATKDNKLISIISLNGGTPPFDLATIDRSTGKITSSAASGLPSLESGRRYSNLAQSSDGKIYGTTIGREGVTNLVQVDLGNKSINRLVQLSYNNQPLENDLLSLAISPSGQFYALANPNYQDTNSLFTLDVKTGVLTLVRQYNADQITFTK